MRRATLRSLIIFTGYSRPIHRLFTIRACFPFLGLLPAPAEYPSDDTRRYLGKPGMPLDNSHAFICTWQRAYGWEKQAQMERANALVPPSGSAAASRAYANKA